jgi:hypothetical protein
MGGAICATLEPNGIRCWIAPRGIMLEADRGFSIVGAITKARLMVLVFSSKANASEHIKRALAAAAAFVAYSLSMGGAATASWQSEKQALFA